MLVSQSARKICLSVDPAMRSMLSANGRNVFPPHDCNSVNKVILKAPFYFDPRKFREGLETRYN